MVSASGTAGLLSQAPSDRALALLIKLPLRFEQLEWRGLDVPQMRAKPGEDDAPKGSLVAVVFGVCAPAPLSTLIAVLDAARYLATFGGMAETRSLWRSPASHRLARLRIRLLPTF